MYYDYKNLYLPEYANQINTVYEKNYGYRLNGLNKKDNKRIAGSRFNYQV